MGKSSKNGKQHLLNVYEALRKQLVCKSISNYSEPVQKTVKYITGKYPNIKKVIMKYELPNPDEEPDLEIITTNGEAIKVNLFSLKSRGKIQPKNPGAKSFLARYFRSGYIQDQFNLFLEREYKLFLQSIVAVKEDLNEYDSETTLKKKVKQIYPSFNEEINPFRTSLLFNLREKLFELLQQQSITFAEGLSAGYRELMLLDSMNIVTHYLGEGAASIVEEWKPTTQQDEIQIYKKGNATVGIRMGQSALTLRLKFESSPDSSLKLATSYDEFPLENKRELLNKKSLTKFQKLLHRHPETVIGNDRNAIGKCNEAMIYAAFIENYPQVYQADSQEYYTMFETYSPKVKEETVVYLKDAAQTAVTEIERYLTKKYRNFELESIQLVPQSYLKNRLDTADIQLSVKSNGKTISEGFSLKAASKRGNWITMKNPGAGTILGPTYFSIGSLTMDTDRVKKQFEEGALTHRESIIEISKSLGEQLEQASQANLKNGLEALLGKAVTVVTFYSERSSAYFEHNQIDTHIKVSPQTPTPINTFVEWNNGEEYLRLRVKFSGGQSRGWTSIKLACEYRVE